MEKCSNRLSFNLWLNRLKAVFEERNIAGAILAKTPRTTANTINKANVDGFSQSLSLSTTPIKELNEGMISTERIASKGSAKRDNKIPSKKNCLATAPFLAPIAFFIPIDFPCLDLMAKVKLA